MDDANARFVKLASPHSWLHVADNLHGQALHLYSRQGQSTTTFVDFKNSVRKTWNDTNRSVFLLGGFALENAIKSFLVYENPNWISNGRLSRRLKSHSLTSLQKQSSLIPFKNRYLGVLQKFEEGLESWVRYPMQCVGCRCNGRSNSAARSLAGLYAADARIRQSNEKATLLWLERASRILCAVRI